ALETASKPAAPTATTRRCADESCWRTIVVLPFGDDGCGDYTPRRWQWSAAVAPVMDRIRDRPLVRAGSFVNRGCRHAELYRDRHIACRSVLFLSCDARRGGSRQVRGETPGNEWESRFR